MASHIGKLPIEIPAGVEVTINGQEFTVLIHFRAGCREKAQDKVKRMLRSDVQNAELSA